MFGKKGGRVTSILKKSKAADVREVRILYDDGTEKVKECRWPDDNIVIVREENVGPTEKGNAKKGRGGTGYRICQPSLSKPYLVSATTQNRFHP